MKNSFSLYSKNLSSKYRTLSTGNNHHKYFFKQNSLIDGKTGV